MSATNSPQIRLARTDRAANRPEGQTDARAMRACLFLDPACLLLQAPCRTRRLDVTPFGLGVASSSRVRLGARRLLASCETARLLRLASPSAPSSKPEGFVLFAKRPARVASARPSKNPKALLGRTEASLTSAGGPPRRARELHAARRRHSPSAPCSRPEGLSPGASGSGVPQRAAACFGSCRIVRHPRVSNKSPRASACVLSPRVAKSPKTLSNP